MCALKLCFDAVLSQIFADELITFGVSGLRPVNDQHKEQGNVLLRRRKAIEKCSRFVEAGNDQHVLPVALNRRQTTGQDGVAGEVFMDQKLRATSSVKSSSDGQRLHTASFG